MAIALKPETERQIEDHVKAGGYRSADDVVRAGLELLEQEKLARKADIEDLRQEIALGVAQLDRGEGLDGEHVFDELLDDLKPEDRKGRP